MCPAKRPDPDPDPEPPEVWARARASASESLKPNFCSFAGSLRRNLSSAVYHVVSTSVRPSPCLCMCVEKGRKEDVRKSSLAA